MKCFNLSLQGHTTICQKVPTDFEDKLKTYKWYTIELQKRQDFTTVEICKGNETPIWLVMPLNYAIAQKGAK